VDAPGPFEPQGGDLLHAVGQRGRRVPGHA
jgi:hypothetical protein